MVSDREKIRILNELDIDGAIAAAENDNAFIPDTREMVLAGLHKARLAQPSVFSIIQRADSYDWLLNHGYLPRIMKHT